MGRQKTPEMPQAFPAINTAETIMKTIRETYPSVYKWMIAAAYNGPAKRNKTALAKMFGINPDNIKRWLDRDAELLELMDADTWNDVEATLEKRRTAKIKKAG